MAVNSFDSHLAEIGTQLQEFRKVASELELLLSRHTHNGYASLVTGSFAGRSVDKEQYDNALSSIDNLLNTWLAGGHGTNIDEYLYEVP